MRIGYRKLRAIYVYQILLEAEQPLTRQAIYRKLKNEYGIEESTKTLTALLRDMMDAELIDATAQSRISVLRDKSGCQEEVDTTIYTDYVIKDRPLEDKELLWIIDNAIFSKQLSQGESKRMVDKLVKLGSKTLRDKIRFLGDNKHYFHTANANVSGNIEILSHAIHHAKSISCILTEYSSDKKLHPVSDEPLLVKPIRMVPLNGFYYLIAYDPGTRTFQHYRIDKMSDIRISDEYIDYDTRNNRLKLDAYLSSHSIMGAGESRTIKIRLPQEKIGLIIDRFGDKFYTANDGHNYIIVTLTSVEADLYSWALENGEFVEIIEPQHIRNKIRETVKAMTRQYLKSDEDRYFEAIERAKKTSTFFCKDFDFSKRAEWLSIVELDDLELDNNGFIDLTMLQGFKKLTGLSMKNEHVTDISVIETLPLLNNISLINTDVVDISSLRGRNIPFVELVDNRNIIDYSPLYEIANLRLLAIDYRTAEQIDTERLIRQNDPLEIVVQHPEGETIHIYSPSLLDSNRLL